MQINLINELQHRYFSFSLMRISCNHLCRYVCTRHLSVKIQRQTAQLCQHLIRKVCKDVRDQLPLHFNCPDSMQKSTNQNWIAPVGVLTRRCNVIFNFGEHSWAHLCPLALAGQNDPFMNLKTASQKRNGCRQLADSTMVWMCLFKKQCKDVTHRDQVNNKQLVTS